MSCRSHFNSLSTGLPCYLSKCPLKRAFLYIYLTTFFGVRQFKNTSPMRVIFFLKMFKIESTFQNYKKKKKKTEKVSAFWDNCISICCYKLSVLRTEYLPSAANVLTKSPKILHITRRHCSHLKYLHID